MPLPVRLEEREPVDGEHLGQPVGGGPQDAFGVVLGLQRPCGFDEEAREAPVVEADAACGRHGDHLDRRLERVTAFMEDADLAALKPRDGHDVVSRLRECGVDDQRLCEMRAHAVLDARPRRLLTRRPCCRCPGRRCGRRGGRRTPPRPQDPLWRPRSSTSRAGSVGSRKTKSARRSAMRCVSRVGETTPSTASRNPCETKLAEAFERDLAQRGLCLGADDPGDLGRVQAEPSRRGGDGELGRGEDLVRAAARAARRVRCAGQARARRKPPRRPRRRTGVATPHTPGRHRRRGRSPAAGRRPDALPRWRGRTSHCPSLLLSSCP